MTQTQSIAELIPPLHAIGAIKFGQFELQRGLHLPFAIDFAPILARPSIAKAICKALWEKGRNLTFDCICGVPGIGAALTTFISWNCEFPMVMRTPDRKEGIQICGLFKSGQRCLVIQDALMTGKQTLDLIDDLEAEGLKVIDTLSFVDLQLGGKQRIKQRGYTPHTLTTLAELFQLLYDQGKLTGDQFKRTIDFLQDEPG